MRTGFFFQGNTILLPHELSELDTDNEISLDCIEKFREIPDYGSILNNSFNQIDYIANTNIDQFEIPDISGTLPIRVIHIPPGMGLPAGWKAVPVRERLPFLSIGMTQGEGRAGRLLRAFHIARWRGESRFCGSCGARNIDSPEELARLCPACGRLEYPRIAPAIIVIVTNDNDQVLLAHNKKFTTGIYSLIAGFNEAGESLESTVEREVREEVNIEITDLRYIVSQPWPFPNSLMLGFSARHAHGEITADNVEIEDARWWSRDALPPLPGNASVSRYLINRWLEGQLTINN